MVIELWVHWAQRGLRLMAASALVLLAACGSSSKYDEFIPKRIVSIGDALSYIGDGTDRYTVNGSTELNNWVLRLADRYGLASSQVVESISATAKASNTDLQPLLNTVTPAPDDLLVISVGIQDVIEQADLVANGSKTLSDATRDAKLAGNRYRDFAIAQLDLGFPRIFMMPVFDFSNSPFATGQSYAAYGTTVSALVASFNEGMITNAGSYASSSRKILTYTEGFLVSLAQTQLYYGAIGISNVSDELCTAANIQACSVTGLTNATLLDTYFYTKDFYPTPRVHRHFGDTIYNFFRSTRGW